MVWCGVVWYCGVVWSSTLSIAIKKDSSLLCIFLVSLFFSSKNLTSFSSPLIGMVSYVFRRRGRGQGNA